MKTQDEINRAATEYAPHDEYHGATYQTNLLMKRQGFVRGANFANGYSVDEMCGFGNWIYNHVRRAPNDEFYIIDEPGIRTYKLEDLLKLYNEWNSPPSNQ